MKRLKYFMDNDLKENPLPFISALSSILMGWFIVAHDNYLDNRSVYAPFTNLFDDQIVGLILLIEGLAIFILWISHQEKWLFVLISVDMIIFCIFAVGYYFRELEGFPTVSLMLVITMIMVDFISLYTTKSIIVWGRHK